MWNDNTLENFQKIFWHASCRDPKILFSFVIRWKLFQHPVAIKQLFVVGAQGYGGAKTQYIGKIWTLTSIISLRQRDPTHFALKFVLGMQALSFELGQFMGSYRRVELWGIENGTRALFVKGSGARNMTRQRDPNFFYFCYKPNWRFQKMFYFFWDDRGARFCVYGECTIRFLRAFWPKLW